MIVDVATATVDDTITVGTKPFSVAYNPDGTKIAVANYNSNNIMIVDVATATVDDTITVGTLPVSVAYNPDGTKIAVANHNSNNIQEIAGA
jgi:YVTN family beta-propeller protein